MFASTPSSRAPSLRTRLRPRLRPLPLALLACVGASHALAAEPTPTLNPVVVTGSRVEAASFDLPFSVDSVDMQAVQAGNLGVNASEALAGVPGLVVQNRQNYAQDLQISVRGFGSRAAFGVRGVKLIADGIPASTPDGQGQAATFNLDTAERIEVMRGPFSTVYGNHAGGVIQLFSRDPKGAPMVRGGVMGGSWGTSKVDIGAEGEQNGVGYVVDASRFDTDGYRDHSAATRDQLFGKLLFRPDQDSKLTLVANALRQDDTDDPLGIKWETFKDDPRDGEIDQNDTQTPKRTVAERFDTRKSIDHRQGGATYERRFGAGRLQLSAYAGERSVIQYQAIPRGPQLAARHSGGVIDFDRDFHGLGARWTHTLAAGPGELTLTGGVDYDRSEDARKGYQNFLASSPNVFGVKGALRRDETDTVTSLDPYVQASWKLEKWTLQAGLRHSDVKFEVDDKYIVAGNPDDSGDIRYRKTTPALGIVYQLSPVVNLYASAARGFETPTLTELSYSGTGPTDGFNFGLKPATSKQYELGAKAFVGENTRMNVAVFEIRTKDELVVDSAAGGRTVFKNAGSTLRQGIELAADTEFSRNWRGKLSVTRLHAIYDEAFVTGTGATAKTVEDGKRIPGIPALSAYAELEWKPREGLATALEVLHRGKVYVEDTNTKHAAPAYTLANLRLTAEQRSGHWTFQQMVRVDNLFDKEHVASVIVGDGNDRFYEPGPTRSVYAGIKTSYRF
ncbi:TonB-dependent receptor family protein [Aromatoleum toluclasticum]|uniref:TonB-dependent receptor family protein n=1 Tax=Aromatoleum toluclasticum TaxID=92003 RepID=UPI0005908CCA|nr:TonB-dependent receptor [Aromatoleum toluclasticum]